MHVQILSAILNQILGGIKEALENTPPELSAKLNRHGSGFNWRRCFIKKY